jgi:hypothetical protein
MHADDSSVEQGLDVAVRALTEIATTVAWPARYGGSAPAMQARAREALEEIQRRSQQPKVTPPR